MATLPPSPQYYILPVHLPWPHQVKMRDLDERKSVLASTVYPTEVPEQIREETLRHNMTKLIMARFSSVDKGYYDLINGNGKARDNKLNGAQVKKWADNIQSNWIGRSSWVQKFIIGAVMWSDYQVILDNLNRQVKILTLVPEGEVPGAARLARLAMRRKYKKALRVHQAHILAGATAMIEEADEAVEKALMIRTDTQIQELRKVATYLRQFEEGLVPSNTDVPATIDDVEPAKLAYAAKSIDDRIEFWQQLWNEDTFVSWMWEYSGVLHFRKNWDTDVIRDMYRDKFIALAFAVVEHILVPRRFTASAKLLATSSIVRASIEMKEDASAAYAVFKAADFELGTTEAELGGHGILYVTGSPVKTRRTKKRSREDEGDSRGAVFGALGRAQRVRAA